MKKLTCIATLVLLWILFLAAFWPATAFKVIDQAMCNDVDTKTLTCKLRTGEFDLTDERAYFWFKGNLEDSDVGAKVGVKFYDPDGKLFAAGPGIGITVGSGGEIVVWMAIGISKNGSLGALKLTKGASLRFNLGAFSGRTFTGMTWTTEVEQLGSDRPGEWRAEFTLDDRVVLSEHFRIGKDTDSDGIVDSEEIKIGTAPNKSDTDGDGLNDREEIKVYLTDPLKQDTDGDGLNDKAEIDQGTNPTISDTDGDGLNDGDEVNRYGTKPLGADTDGDHLNDGDEVNKYRTDPLKIDTDGDGLGDSDEIQLGIDPTRADTDADGLDDKLEIGKRTDPRRPDTDGDMWPDSIDPDPLSATTPNMLLPVIGAIVLIVVFLLFRKRRRAIPPSPAYEPTPAPALAGSPRLEYVQGMSLAFTMLPQTMHR